ncbi:MFS transporter [Bacillus sp. 1P06AnD]|uniref:MFS transporter n=1 Tax=Bacillus sp. 1P06AnD TaxID=3132208 RepID=UPI00399FABEA
MRWVMVVFLFFMYMINYLDKAIIGFAAIPIMNDLHLNYSQWGMVGSSFYWLFSIGGILGASLSDRIGTKKILIIMGFAWSFSQLGAFAVYGLPILILTRVILGAFEGPYLATSVSHLTKWFPPERRGLAISITNSGSLAAKLLTPFIIFIIGSVGWRMGFGFLGTLSIIWVILWIWIGKDHPLNKVNKHNTAIKERKTKWADIYPALLSRTFIFTCLAFFSTFWVLAWSLVWEPTYLTKIIHLTPKQMGLYYAIVGFPITIGTILLSSCSDYIYKKTQSIMKSRVFVAGGTLVLGALCFYSLVFIRSTIPALIMLSLAGLFTNIMFPLAPQIVNHLLPEKKGLLSGVLIGIANTAGIISPIITGFVVQAGGSDVRLGFNHSVELAVGMLLVTGLLFLFFAKPNKNETPAYVKQTNASL